MFNNPYMTNMFPYPSNSPSSVEIPHVNGIESARNYPLPTNSSALVLDNNAPIVYMITTDSAGFKTIKPYAISEYKPEPEVDVRSLLNRVDAIERRLNHESDTSTAERPEPNTSASRSSKVIDEYDSMQRKSTGGNAKLFSE